MDLGIQSDRVKCMQIVSDGFNGGLTIVKVKSVEVHPLHQITQPLRLKRGQARVTNLPVGRCMRELTNHLRNITKAGPSSRF